jgi:4-hydroxyphenylacetate 3-monooxygenase
MGARTGQQYIDGLRDDREVWIDGERVKDVTTDPRFAGAIRSLAELFDMQHDPEYQDVLTYVSPTTGDRVGLSFIEPRTQDDLVQRRKMVKTWMDRTCGMFGRSPDFMNIHTTAFASAADELGKSEPKFGANVRSYYEHIRENDVVMTHVLVNPQVDRSRAVEEQDKDLAAKIVKETDAGIVIRGARMVATLGAISDDIMVMPNPYLQENEAAKDYAFGFTIPVSAPGVKAVCRPSVAHLGAASPMDYPLSSRLDETDAFLIFDDVLVPWERVFIYRDVQMCNGLFNRTGAMEQIMHQFTTKNLAKAEFMMSLAFALVDTTKVDAHLNVQGLLSELITNTEIVRACLTASETEATQSPFGTMTPAREPLWAMRLNFPIMFRRMSEILQIIGAGGLVQVPSYAELDSGIGEFVSKYCQAANADAASRVKLFRLAYDACVSSFAGRQQLYERYYSGDPVRLAGTLYGLYEKEPYIERIWDLLDQVEQQTAASSGQTPKEAAE